MACSLRLSRVLALVGGLGLVAAFFMPWFSSQGLLLSGQFLDLFLATPSDTELRQFLPASPPGDVQLLRVLVDLFPVCGVVAAAAALVGGIAPRGQRATDIILGVAGVVPLLAWAGGITRLPSGAAPEVGLWLIALGALAIVVGLLVDVAGRRVR